MRRVLTLMCALIPSAAMATGEIYCRAPDDSAGFSALVGSVPGLALVGAQVEANGQVWQMTGGSDEAIPGAVPMMLAQGAADRGRLIIDFTDPNFERIIASVRLVSASTDEGFAEAGTLAIPGVGVWPLICEY